KPPVEELLPLWVPLIPGLLFAAYVGGWALLAAVFTPGFDDMAWWACLAWGLPACSIGTMAGVFLIQVFGYAVSKKHHRRLQFASVGSLLGMAVGFLLQNWFDVGLGQGRRDWWLGMSIIFSPSVGGLLGLMVSVLARTALAAR